jgi:hypothetical protein
MHSLVIVVAIWGTPGCRQNWTVIGFEKNSNNADLSGQTLSRRDCGVRRALFAAAWY